MTDFRHTYKVMLFSELKGAQYFVPISSDAPNSSVHMKFPADVWFHPNPNTARRINCIELERGVYACIGNNALVRTTTPVERFVMDRIKSN